MSLCCLISNVEINIRDEPRPGPGPVLLRPTQGRGGQSANQEPENHEPLTLTSGKLPMDLGIPPLESNIMPEYPLKSRFLVRGLAVAVFGKIGTIEAPDDSESPSEATVSGCKHKVRTCVHSAAH